MKWVSNFTCPREGTTSSSDDTCPYRHDGRNVGCDVRCRFFVDARDEDEGVETVGENVISPKNRRPSRTPVPRTNGRRVMTVDDKRRLWLIKRHGG